MANSTYTIPQAIDVFVHGFCLSKSQTYPYQVELYREKKLGSIWIMQDTPTRKGARKAEIVSYGNTPEKAIELVRNSGVGWHFLCDIHSPDSDFASIRSGYKALGYRALSTEWLFVHDLKRIPSFKSAPPAREIKTAKTLDSIPHQANQKRRMIPNTRLFGVWNEEQDMGWVRSIPVGDASWVSDLFVYPSNRGMGYGRALMSKLLKIDRSHGITQSVLLASSDGARLYPHLGYKQIGVLQMFCPVK